MTFYQIDDDAVDPDRPLCGRMAQDMAESAAQTRTDRLRRASRCWDVRNAPVACGTYSWATQDEIVRIMLPFIWRRTFPGVNELTVTVRHTVVSGNVTVGAVALPLTTLGAWPNSIPSDTSLPNVAETSVGTSATAVHTALTLDISEIAGDDLMVFVTFKSEEVATYVSAITSMNWYTTRMEGTSSIATMRPCLGLRTDWNPTAGGGPYSWETIDGVSKRQIIFSRAGVDDFYVYPPYTKKSDQLSIPRATGAMDGTTILLSSAAIYAVEIEETGTPDTFDEYNSSLNPGQPDSSLVVRTAIYGRQEKTFLRHTKVHHIGPASVDPDQRDNVLSATEYLNRVNGFVRFETNNRALASCYVTPSNDFDDIDGTDSVLVAYDVVALLAVAGTRESPVMDFDAWLTLSSAPGSVAVTGERTKCSPRMMRCEPSSTAERRNYHPIGYLLRLAYPSAWTQTSITDTNQIAHTLLGFYPEDTWHRGRPGRSPDDGEFWVYEETIIDTTNATRQLTLWVDGDQPATPQAYTHCVSWHVQSRQVSEAERLSTYSVAR